MVDVECSLCPRRGRYRLARLAERYGSAVPLARLLELIAADCTLMKPGEKPRQYEARCGIRYFVPAPEPLPLDAPARAGESKPGPAVGAKRKRLGPDGPPPTLGQVRRQGCTGISATRTVTLNGFSSVFAMPSAFQPQAEEERRNRGARA